VPTSNELLVFSQWFFFSKGAFGIDQHVGDVLDVADFPFAAAYFEQRVVGGALGVGRIEQQHPTEARTPAGGQAPILTLYVMDDR
jgi:hypothetical protein